MNANTVVAALPAGYRWATPHEVETWTERLEEMVQVRVGGSDDDPETDLAIRKGEGMLTPHDRENVPKRTVYFNRARLVRLVQTYEVEIPADYDVEEWMENDGSGLDQFVCDQGHVVAEEQMEVDHHDDELDLREIPPPAQVVKPFVLVVDPDNPGLVQTRCPHCSAMDSIVEVDKATRFNELTDLTPDGTCTASTGQGDYEFDHWFCTACESEQIAEPDGFKITSWY